MAEIGIKSVLIVSGKGHAGHFLELLGSGAEFGLNLSYEVQEEAGGIAQALLLAEDFCDTENLAVMLGDNLFQNSLKDDVEKFKKSNNKAHIFLKKVNSPSSYGVPRFENDKIVEIIEKPKLPPSNFAVTGFYLYKREVFEMIKTLKPSARGELEISEVNDYYVKKSEMSYSILDGFWGDCGESFDSLIDASLFVQKNK